MTARGVGSLPPHATIRDATSNLFMGVSTPWGSIAGSGPCMTDRASSLTIRDTGTVPIASVANVIDACQRRGSAAALCEAVELDPERPAGPAARIPMAPPAAVYEAPARRTRDPAVGARGGAPADNRP